MQNESDMMLQIGQSDILGDLIQHGGDLSMKDEEERIPL